MKLTLLTLTIIVTAATAQDSDHVPAKMAALRSSYEAAINRATGPITATYLTELQKLKTELTKSGDLKGALAADEEIKRLSTPPLDSSAPAAPEHPQSLVGKSFQFIRRGSITLMTFGEDGKVQGHDHPNEALWSVSQKGFLQFKHPTGVVTSVFDKKKLKDGLLRFEGTAMLDAKKKLDIEHVLQEVRK